jgi:RNA polymerase sigma-70 factor (sigma-E family)
MDRNGELREFVAARGAALSRAAYLLTGDRHAAEDLVQETYVVMVRQWRRIDSSNPEPYVRRIMYSRFVDGWRRRHLAEVPTATPSEVGDPVDESGRAVDRLTLGDALLRLTPRQRAVLVLRFFEDLTEAQAAAALGVSTSTVKSQTRVALQRLRDLAPAAVASFEPSALEVME